MKRSSHHSQGPRAKAIDSSAAPPPSRAGNARSWAVERRPGAGVSNCSAVCVSNCSEGSGKPCATKGRNRIEYGTEQLHLPHLEHVWSTQWRLKSAKKLEIKGPPTDLLNDLRFRRVFPLLVQCSNTGKYLDDNKVPVTCTNTLLKCLTRGCWWFFNGPNRCISQ